MRLFKEHKWCSPYGLAQLWILKNTYFLVISSVAALCVFENVISGFSGSPIPPEVPPHRHSSASNFKAEREHAKQKKKKKFSR